jgi:hypothetical protein
MARERVLTKPVSVTVDKGTPVAKGYDTVRFFGAITFHVGQDFTEQCASFSWAIGKVDINGKFAAAPVEGMCGIVEYNNRAPEYAFAHLLERAAGGKEATLSATQDVVFADLEAAGLIPAGTNRDYALYPPGYTP